MIAGLLSLNDDSYINDLRHTSSFHKFFFTPQSIGKEIKIRDLQVLISAPTSSRHLKPNPINPDIQQLTRHWHRNLESLLLSLLQGQPLAGSSPVEQNIKSQDLRTLRLGHFGDSKAQWLTHLLLDPTASGLIPSIPPNTFQLKNDRCF